LADVLWDILIMKGTGTEDMTEVTGMTMTGARDTFMTGMVAMMKEDKPCATWELVKT